MIASMAPSNQSALDLPPGETVPLQSVSQPPAPKKRKVRLAPKHMAITSMPYNKPDITVEKWVRKNGPETVTWQAGTGQDENGETVSIGLPYGMMARLIGIWCASEAYRTKSRELELGGNLAEFMEQIGIEREQQSGGVRGNIGVVREQADKLFSSSMSVRVEAARDGSRPLEHQLTSVAVGHTLWLTQSETRGRKSQIEQTESRKSTVTLSQEYYDMAIKNPVPVDANTIRKLRGDARGSAMAFDLYVWLTRRMSYEEEYRLVSWNATMSQFGSTVTPTSSRQAIRKYRLALTSALDRVLDAYPKANARIVEKGILVGPGATDVPPKGWNDRNGLEEQWYEENGHLF
ncbi:replication protein RepA [Nocardia altamirensis]|uniref:replication protein RepA n=1 Tax=Nocardia altamirensis TaxID=472158 RepID=UPI00084072DA|nr:replication protein RepA [Nocardia altamirensis]